MDNTQTTTSPTASEPTYTWDENPSQQPVQLTTDAIDLLTAAIEAQLGKLMFSRESTAKRDIRRLQKLHATLRDLL
jgi:hypothetical protein